MTNYIEHSFDSKYCTVQIASFSSENGVEEQHLMFHAVPTGTFGDQLNAINEVKKSILNQYGEECLILFQRYFFSDIANQADLIETAPDETIPTSFIQQPPLDGSKVALWMYITKGKANKRYRHLWTANKFATSDSVYNQSKAILEDYHSFLNSNNCQLKDNCIRTWFFVQDVDTNYADFVKARKAFFDKYNLTDKTHYIASTGIEGRNASRPSLVTMDAYAIEGIDKQQIKHLHALSHLSPTHVYGVTFERGVAVTFGDRQHIYISGTASIDNKGDVLHVGNVVAQTYRMLENIEALLNEADATMSDIIQGIVYLRDTADYMQIKTIFEDKFPGLPLVITLAPVCRPAWLIEMECIAVSNKGDNRFADF